MKTLKALSATALFFVLASVKFYTPESLAKEKKLEQQAYICLGYDYVTKPPALWQFGVSIFPTKAAGLTIQFRKKDSGAARFFPIKPGKILIGQILYGNDDMSSILNSTQLQTSFDIGPGEVIYLGHFSIDKQDKDWLIDVKCDSNEFESLKSQFHIISNKIVALSSISNVEDARYSMGSKGFFKLNIQ